MSITQLVIFDCDGTLVDTEILHAAALMRCLELHGISYSQDDFIHNFAGFACERIIAEVNKRHGAAISQDTVDRMHVNEMKRAIPLHMRVLEDSLDYVRALAARGDVGLAVGSNGNREIVLHALEYAGYLDHIDPANVRVAADVAAPKPAPDLYMSIAEDFVIDPALCVVVEDSPAGALAGLRAGMRTVGYTGLAPDEKAARDKLEKAGVSIVINQLSQLDSHLF